MKRIVRALSVVLLFLPFFLLAQETTDVIVPNENLVVDQIPAIPASLAEAVGRYSEFRFAIFSSWHPTRREMLINTQFADTYQIHRVSFPGGARTQMTFFRDNVFAGDYEPSKGDSFVFMKDKGGNELYQLYRYDVPTGGITMLTDGKSRNTGPVWSYTGERIAYSSTRRNGKDVDIWMMDATDPATNRIAAQLEGGGWSVGDWSRDGSKLLIRNDVSAAESYLWILDVATGEKTLLTPKPEKDTVLYGLAKFTKDAKGVYVTSDKDSEFQRLAIIDVATKAVRLLTPNLNWDVDDIALSDDGATIAFFTNEDGMSVLHLMDTKTGKEKFVPPLPIGTAGGLAWHKNGRDLAFRLSTPQRPWDVYSLDVAAHKLERWTMSETGGLNTETFGKPELIKWKSFDDRMISGFLVRPPKNFTGKRPVIIAIHGGPEGQYRPDFLDRDSYFINELGVAMIFPNVRGSTGYGKSFQKLDNGFLREGTYKDIGALLQWIKSRPDLDADRIMVTGGSYGGHMVLATSTFYADQIRCAVDIVGISNLVTFLENTSPYRQDLRRVEYGDERDPKMREFLTRIAPSTNADKIKKPLLVVQGMNDPRVPRSEAEQIVATVRKNGTPVWYLMAKDEGHGFAKKKNADFEFYATVAFVQEFLLK